VVLLLSFSSVAGQIETIEPVGTTGGSRNGEVLKRFRVTQVRRAGVQRVFQFLLITVWSVREGRV